ncbi:hypothetical protein DUI87_02000 [Hirundo rustica rustica]|uniref:CCHC-type domain-containing protein n=1 Tax=Hirundo rustica rustica TaxID=333673 RepID=A0A3M0L632_HIRRU|nr:hypothetical protein DUI87_02000 [Hirundo rustica rustica]
MVEQDDVEIVVTNIVNPASFLSGSMGEPVIHDCLEAIEATYSSCPDLKDTPLEDAETWFTDGSSYVISGRRHVGYAVTMSREFMLMEPSGKKEDCRIDKKKSIKHAQEIIELLEAVQVPENVAIMHIKAHQKVSSELEEENKLADRKAKAAAKGEVIVETVEAALIPDEQISIEGGNFLSIILIYLFITQFVDRLRSQVERQVQDPEVQAELIKEMAQRNGNGTCRRIILSLPLDPSPSLAQMIEACTKKVELFSASERNPGLTHPKPVAAAAPGERRQPMSSDQLQHIICHRCKRPGHFAKACPENQKHLLIRQ